MNKNPRLIDLQGQRFGRWLVSTQAGNALRGGALWNAVCDCGKTGTPTGGDLRAGKSTSCGCLTRESARRTMLTHGGVGTRIYRIWKAMRTRCSNPNIPGAKNYSERGITICKEWGCFDVFRAWALENGYSDDLSIERIDVNSGYNPTNCTWANAQEQSINRRFVKKNEHGEAWSQIAKRHGVGVTLMHGRIHEGWPIEKAATLPKGSRLRDS